MNLRTIGIIISVLTISVLALGCTGNDSLKGSAEPVEATWISPMISEDTVSIPLEAVDKNTNVHFKVNTASGELAVMAYSLDDKIFIRSNVCPPCGSLGFALDRSTLICDTCATTFDASTGMGIEGACVAYPKEDIPYTVSDGNLIMQLDDVMNAHRETLKMNPG
jgi:nitrite reductase/ring-hydroxylating ferredoxin subunit